MQLKRLMGVAAGLLLFAGPAYAGSVLFDSMDPEVALGLQSVDINGTPYDIEFEFGTYDDVYGTPPPGTSPPAFFDDQSAAETAVDAIVALLNPPSDNDPDIFTQVAEAGGTNADNRFLVPFEFSGSNDSFVRNIPGDYGIANDPGDQDWERKGIDTEIRSSSNNLYTVFTVVPEPGTALLLGLGIVGMGLRRAQG